LRKKGTIHQNTLFFYSSVITITTISLIVTCFQTPFIAPQWQTSILPPPSYDNWNDHMMLMSVLFLALLFFHAVYVIYSFFRLLLIPSVKGMIFTES